MPTGQETLGLIAGQGNLPVETARGIAELRLRGERVVVRWLYRALMRGWRSCGRFVMR